MLFQLSESKIRRASPQPEQDPYILHFTHQWPFKIPIPLLQSWSVHCFQILVLTLVLEQHLVWCKYSFFFTYKMKSLIFEKLSWQYLDTFFFSRPNYKKVFETVRCASRTSSLGSNEQSLMSSPAPRLGVTSLTPSTSVMHSATRQRRISTHIPGYDSPAHSDIEEITFM